jgi:hypothetical protein
VLLKAIEKADADVEKAKRDADEKKWRIVADQMKVLKVWMVSPILAYLTTNSILSSLSSTSPRTPAATASRPSKLARPSHLPSRSRTLTSKPSRASNHVARKSRRFKKTPILLLLTPIISRAMLGLLACVPTTDRNMQARNPQSRGGTTNWRVPLRNRSS